MRPITPTCDQHRLEAFLQGDLNAVEEDDLALHLNDCVGCRERLEASAAEPACWSKAGELLQPNEFGDEDPAARPPRRSLQVEHVLDALAPTDDPEMLGRLGGYEVSGVVGTGGMGVVLKAHDKSLDRTVAIKVLAPHLASSGAARKRFAREAKAAAAVLHPNVMAIHSVSNDESLPYLVMPYLRGAALQKRIDDEGSLTVGEILRIGSQIAAGLAAAHAQGLVHRDIKPANILLEDGVERVAITDFGLARAVDDATMTRTGVIAGTPQYMSPEQARGEAVDQRSDLFSLGSVLYAMCTGRPPFRAETSYGILRRITDNEPRPIREINPDVPEWLCAMIARLMAKCPADRFASASEVAELLEACLAHVQQPTAVPLPQSCLALHDSRKTDQPLGASPRFPRKPPANAVRLVLGIALSFLLILVGILIVLELNKGTLTIQCDADDVPIRIVQRDVVVQELTISKDGATVRVAAGMYVVEIDGEIDGIVVQDGTITLKRGAAETVRIVSSVGEGRAIGFDDKDEPRAWQQTEPYIGPSFADFFADDADGGIVLDRLWNAADKDSRTDQEILDTVRRGLRRTREHRTLVLGWLGNKYIWNKSPQNPDAIEIMYHAADFSGERGDPYGTRHYAVYFGLSVVQPKSPAILRTLAELGMRVDDPNDLGRIAWGTSDQKQELLEYLRPFHAADDETVRSKAAICEKIFSGELKAFAWAAEQARRRAMENYADQLPQFKEVLQSGSSEDRRKTLETILGERISLIMDDSFLAALAKCAEDSDPGVRDQATIIAGGKWIWEAENQHPDAIKLMLRLSEDTDRQVRYDAVYYGLSTVRNKSDDVVRRLLEMALADREWNLFSRIEWGLRDDRERAAKMLDGYMEGSNQQHATAAREIFHKMIGRDPSGPGGANAPMPSDDFPSSFDEPHVFIERYQRIGVVTAVSDSHKDHISISLGSADGIRPEQRLQVSDGSSPLGTVEVTAVRQNESYARVVEWMAEQPVRKGDRVNPVEPRDQQTVPETNGADDSAVEGTRTVPGGVHSADRKRENRWEIRYPIEPSRFAEALDFFRVELGVADRSRQEITYLSGLSAVSPAVSRGPTASETRLYLPISDAGAERIARSLLEQAGIETRDRVLLSFYTPWAERTLAALEARAADLQSIDLVDKTVFGVHPHADGFEFYVISQEAKSRTNKTSEPSDQNTAASEPIHEKLAEICSQAHAGVTSIATIQYRFELKDDEGWHAKAEFYGDQERFRVNRDDVTGIMGLDAELKPKRSEPMKIAAAFDGQFQHYRRVIDGTESLRSKAGRAGASYGISTPQLHTYLWLRNGSKEFHWDTILGADLWERRFKDATYVGDVTEDGRRFEIVDFPQRSVRVPCIYRVYFARDLGFLPLKYFRHTLAKNELSTTMEVTRFKTFTIDGKPIAIPLEVRHQETQADGVSKKGERTMTVDEDSLKVNEPLDDSLFTLSRVDDAPSGSD